MDKELAERLESKFQSEQGAVDPATAQRLEVLFRKMTEPEDKVSGAPAPVRGVVGNAPPQDRLANLRRFYPDAEPYDGDNFVFTDPGTGLRTLYNPKGIDSGDFASVTREGAEFIGGAVGAVAGAPVATPYGSVVGAGLGAEIAGQGVDALMRGTQGMIDTRSGGQIGLDATVGVGVNAVGQAGGMAAENLMKGTFAGLRNLTSTRPPDALVRGFKEVGAEPTPAMVAGGTVQGLESAMSKMPGAADLFGGRYQSVLDSVSGEANRIVNRLAEAPSAMRAGAAVQTGAKEFLSRTGTRFEAMQEKFFDGLPGGTLIPTMNTRRTLSELTDKYRGDTELNDLFADPFLRRVADTVGSRQGLSVDTFRQLRRDVAQLKDVGALRADEKTAAMKQLYGALSEDLNVAAEAAGPEVAKQFRRMNQMYSAAMRRWEQILEPLAKQGIPERVYTAVLSGGREGASKVWRVRRSLTDDQWREVAAETARRLGQARPGQQNAVGDAFSPETFLTNFHKLDGATRFALFGGNNMRGALDGLEKLTYLTGALKDGKAFKNYSNTATQLPYFYLLYGVLGGAAGAASGDMQQGAQGVLGGAGLLLGGRTAAKLFLSRPFVNWLAQAPAAAARPSGVSAHLGRLYGIAQAEPEIREEIYQYARALRDFDVPGTAQTGATQE